MATGQNENRDLFDQTFLNIFEGISNAVIEATANSVNHIMAASNEFLSSKAQKALADFHALYFDSANLTNEKSDINKDVDDLFDEIKAHVESGGDVDKKIAGIREDEEKKQMRLSLSAIQKELESVISLDAGVRKKLVPVLTSMQFEDQVRQVLTRLPKIWQIVLDEEKRKTLPDKIISSIQSLLTSKLEQEAFFKEVLKKPLPKMLKDAETWLDSILE